MQPAFELAAVLKKHWPQVLSHAAINSWQVRVLGASRTAGLLPWAGM